MTRDTHLPPDCGVELATFEAPEECRRFPKGRFELLTVGGVQIGRATYEPGWRWSQDVGPAEGRTHCQVEHIGVVLSGRAIVAMDDGTIVEMKPGDVFHIAPGHDSWVVGDQPYVSLHLAGADAYARNTR